MVFAFLWFNYQNECNSSISWQDVLLWYVTLLNIPADRKIRSRFSKNGVKSSQQNVDLLMWGIINYGYVRAHFQVYFITEINFKSKADMAGIFHIKNFNDMNVFKRERMKGCETRYKNVQLFFMTQVNCP